MLQNPTEKGPAKPPESITPRCPTCGKEITAETIQMQLSPHPLPPATPEGIVTMVVCKSCSTLLPIQLTLLGLDRIQAAINKQLGIDDGSGGPQKKSNLWIPGGH